jgi:hypothetical protein
MAEPSENVVERVNVREVAAVFRSHTALEQAVDALLIDGFDRADIDLMASADAVREKLGDVYASPEKLTEVPPTLRREFIAREDRTDLVAGVAGILTYIGATASAVGVVASGGALALAVAAAAAGGAATGALGFALARQLLGRAASDELEQALDTGGLVLWVRVRSPEQEERAQRILREHGGEAVRVHEIEIEKRTDEIPLSTINPDPLLSDEPLGRV